MKAWAFIWEEMMWSAPTDEVLSFQDTRSIIQSRKHVVGRIDLYSGRCPFTGRWVRQHVILCILCQRWLSFVWHDDSLNLRPWIDKLYKKASNCIFGFSASGIWTLIGLCCIPNYRLLSGSIVPVAAVVHLMHNVRKSKYTTWMLSFSMNDIVSKIIRHGSRGLTEKNGNS